MMLEAGLVGSRFVHFACAITLFGSALFGLYSQPYGSQFIRLRPVILSTLALGALLSGLSWFVFTVGNMSGTLTAVFDGDILWSVLWDTDFGRIWAVRIPATILILVATGLRGLSTLSHRLIVLLNCFLAGIVLASLAGVGHTQIHEGVPAVVHVTADAVHLLAAGAWLGGLLPLSVTLLTCRTMQMSKDDAVSVLSRFSGMGYLAVSALVASGAINSWFLVGSLRALTDTGYGQLLLLKLGLFGLMLVLAASNRFWLVPALAKSRAGSQSDLSLEKLRYHVLGEQVLGLLVVGIVSVLGTLPPGLHHSRIAETIFNSNILFARVT